MAVGLLTDWITIGVSGPTVDGRTISADDLTLMAKNYNPDIYTAVVNVEHYYGNLGTVRELRTVSADGDKTALQARIHPNQYMLQQNAAGLRLFSSMEITRNFAKSGEPYLTGVATTDTPASLGTTEIHFSRSDASGVERSEAFELDTNVFKSQNGNDNNNLFHEFFNRLGEFFNPAKTQKDDESMNKDELKAALTEAFAPIGEKLDSLTEAFKTPKTESAVPPATETPKVDAENTEGKVDFAKITEAVTALSAEVKGMTEKLTAILAEKPGTNFGKSTGPADDSEKFI